MGFFDDGGCECLLVHPGEPNCRFSTPFEDWCERLGLHPDEPGAWERFEGAFRTPPPAPGAGRGAA